MKKDQIIELLTSLGLTDNESAVYLSMLSLGPTTVLTISKQTGIRRTTVYPTLDSLKQKGLVKEAIFGFKTKYEAENPHKLEQMLEYKRNDLMHSIPELMSLYNLQGGDSVIKYYEGLEAVKSIYDDLANELRDDDFYYVVSNLDAWKKPDENFFLEYKEKIKKINMDARILSPDCDLIQQFIKYEKNYNHQAAIIPLEEELRTDMMITPHKLVIVQVFNPIVGMVIQNQAIINMQKTMFLMLWNFIKGSK